MGEYLVAIMAGRRTHAVNIGTEFVIAIQACDQILRDFVVSDFRELIRDGCSN